jgi:hypothetical protein
VQIGEAENQPEAGGQQREAQRRDSQAAPGKRDGAAQILEVIQHLQHDFQTLLLQASAGSGTADDDKSIAMAGGGPFAGRGVTGAVAVRETG